MSYLDPILVTAKRNPFGDRRFYPPGEHPIIRRKLDYLAALVKLRGQMRDAGLSTIHVDASIEYVEVVIAAFEEGESIAKADYLRMLR